MKRPRRGGACGKDLPRKGSQAGAPVPSKTPSNSTEDR